MVFMLSYLLQKDVAEAEHWVARVRRREWGEERYQELSTLHTQWGQQQGQPCIVHTGHVLSNHRTLADYTLPVNVLNDGSLSVYSSKSRFIPELCTPHCILTLGNILSCIGTQVSSVSWVSGQGTFRIAALAPFTVGWWSDASNFIFYLYVEVYYSIKIFVLCMSELVIRILFLRSFHFYF